MSTLNVRAGTRVRARVLAVLVSALAVAFAGVPASAADDELTKAERAELDLSLAAIETADLGGVAASTPTPTTEPIEVVAAGDQRDTYCGNPVAAAAAVERAERSGVDTAKRDSPDPEFSFVYADGEVALYTRTSLAKQFMKQARAAMESCTSYHYTSKPDERFVAQRGAIAPKAGDQTALLVATLILPSGRSRDDVFSVVRVGPLVSNYSLQVSGNLTKRQIAKIAKAQSADLEEVLASAKSSKR